MVYHKPYTNKQAKIEERLEAIRKSEQALIKKVDIDIKRRMHTRRAYFEVMHFTFNDFAQVTIGSCVFSFAPFLDTDPWNYLPNISTTFLFAIHLFFICCVFIALNYEFRNNFKLDWWFLRLLVKRFFYIYLSVMIVMSLILILMNRLTYESTNIEALRNLMIIQTAGLFGATTYSFLKK